MVTMDFGLRMQDAEKLMLLFQVDLTAAMPSSVTSTRSRGFSYKSKFCCSTNDKDRSCQPSLMTNALGPRIINQIDF